MTVQGLFREACLHFAQQSTNERFTADFYSAIMAAQKQFIRAKAGQWNFLLTTGTCDFEEDDNSSALPSDFGKFLTRPGTLRITSPSTSVDAKVTLVGPRYYYSNEYSTSAEGQPQYAWRMGDTLYVAPIPDDDYTLSFVYYKQASEVNDTSDDLTVDSDYDDVLRLMIYRHLTYMGYEDMDEMAITDQQIRWMLKQAARDDSQRLGGLDGLNLLKDGYTIETAG